MNYLLSIVAAVVLFHLCRADDFHLEYYKPVSMSCDAEAYNISNVQTIVSRYWLIPNGDLLDGFTDTEYLNVASTSNFSLTINKIDDADFGYYYCLIVGSDNSIQRIRHGVNIDGADYGNLLAKYRKNAMIGGIAAGVLFVTVAGFCLVTQLKYKRRNQRNKAVDELDKAIDGYDLKAYDNVGFAEGDTETPATNGPRKTDAELDTEDDKM